jgi:hypothetical protein
MNYSRVNAEPQKSKTGLVKKLTLIWFFPQNPT